MLAPRITEGSMFKKLAIGMLLLAVMSASVEAVTITFTDKEYRIWGNKRVVTGTVTLIGPYSATAFSFSPASIGLGEIEYVFFTSIGYGTNTYTPYWDGTSGYIHLTENTINEYKPLVTPTSSSDSLDVMVKPFVASDADTSVVFVSMLAGSTNPFLGIIGASISPSTSATKWDPYVWMADSITAIAIIGDTASTYPFTRLRGVLSCADTVFFDYNGTTKTSRLMYSGTGLGNMGDLFIPVGCATGSGLTTRTGRFIKICKVSNSERTAAAAKPLHFIHASTAMDDKLIIDAGYASDIVCGVLVDTTYTSLPYFHTVGLAPQTGRSISVEFKFMAIGK